MRKLFLLASLMICLTSVNVFAQETTAAQKTATETEQPKNAVDRALEEAKEHGERIMGTCLMDCDGDGVANSEGVESGQVLALPKPAYPPIARAAHATGTVEVRVIVDFDGSVIAAAAISGHPLLQAAAVAAARNAKFTPLKYKGEPVKVVGVIQYHFVLSTVQ
ncbi:MAG TPA: energy transducer TonB [Pyrinomonadaceae bacterium]|jgi:TonB family protein